MQLLENRAKATTYLVQELEADFGCRSLAACVTLVYRTMPQLLIITNIDQQDSLIVLHTEEFWIDLILSLNYRP